MISPLPPSALRWRVPEGALPFEHTGELEPSEAIVGQAAALEALRRGVEVEAPGYSLFATGLSGGGRLRTLARLLESLAPRRRVRRDMVFVQNLEDPARPVALTFPVGHGARFHADLATLLRRLADEIPRSLEAETVRRRRDALVRVVEREHWQVVGAVQEQIDAQGFELAEQRENGDVEYEILFRLGEQRLNRNELRRVDREAGLPRPLAEVEAQLDALEDQLAGAVAEARRRALATLREIESVEERAVRDGVRPLFDELARRHRPARAWLRTLATAVTHARDRFREGMPAPLQDAIEPLLGAFRANVFHRGGRGRRAPVVIVPDPTFRNVFGGIDQEAALGPADHTHLRAGALHDADGGFLVCNAADLLGEAECWQTLRRAMMFGELAVRNPESGGASPPSALRPDLVPVDVKVVLLGSQGIYNLLYYGDPDFQTIFKMKVEFEDSAEVRDELPLAVARFLARTARRERLRALERDAVAAILEWAVRDSGRGGRMRLSFGPLADLARESDALAAGARITRADVERALRERAARKGLLARRSAEAFRQGLLRLETRGLLVGQVNGLAVIRAGGHTFGRPLRITATAGTGRGGIISIEREAGLSGRSHTKGEQIIAGFLRGRFSRRRTLALTASLSFEQNYGVIDGDSASVAELVALLSALGGVAVDQGVAVTGSVDQLGRIQPIGSVNEKIESFFAMCDERGLTGEQGVVIPALNVGDLCLSHEVVAACAAGRFHIWPATTLEDALGRMTRRPVGDAAADVWPIEHVYGAVARALDELEAVTRQAAKGPEKPKAPPASGAR